MKLKVILIIVLAFIAADCSAYKLIINKTKLDGDGSGLYGNVYRNVTDETVNIEGVPVLQTRTISIFCQGSGSNSCPNNIAYNGQGNGEQPQLSELFSLEAINAAQALLNNADVQSSSGQGNGNDSGTIVTPDGISYLYSVTWNTNASGNTTIYMTFEHASN
jgi:hypothetical protein